MAQFVTQLGFTPAAYWLLTMADHQAITKQANRNSSR